MTTGRSVAIALVSQGHGVRYNRQHPMNPVFECDLDPDLMRRLAVDPGAVLVTPRQPRDFWLGVLVDAIRAGGQYVFATKPARVGGGAQVEVAARTLFQLDGDVVLKIDERVLSRPDAIEVLEAHFGWTDWCLQQLRHALAVPRILRRICWLFLVSGVLLTVLAPAFSRTGVELLGVLKLAPGHWLFPPVVQLLGILMLAPGHWLLPPVALRLSRVLPSLLGVFVRWLASGTTPLLPRVLPLGFGVLPVIGWLGFSEAEVWIWGISAGFVGLLIGPFVGLLTALLSKPLRWILGLYFRRRLRGALGAWQPS